MNCKQVEELLPLYAGRDLDERRERLIGDHVRSCTGCAAAADEFRAARQLIGESESPQFSEDVFAEIRQDVWRRIEAESNVASSGRLIPAWFSTPRVAWVLASAVLIAVFVFAVYLFGSRQTTQPPVAGSSPQTNQNPVASQPDAEPNSGAPKVAPQKGAPLQADLVKPPRRIVRKTRGERTTSLAANSTAAQSNNVATSNQSDSQAGAGTTLPNSEIPLRMEIQTRDPNIRIIWFAQPETKPTKGT